MRFIVTIAAILGLSGCTSEDAARGVLEEKGFHAVELTRTSPVHFGFEGRDAKNSFCVGNLEKVGQSSKWNWVCQGKNPDPVCSPTRLEDCIDAAVAAESVDEFERVAPLRTLCVYDGHSAACTLLSQFAEKAEAWRSMAASSTLACGRGRLEGCVDRSVADWRLEDAGSALIYADHACKSGAVQGCVNAAFVSDKGGDAEATARYRARACALDTTRCPEGQG